MSKKKKVKPTKKKVVVPTKSRVVPTKVTNRSELLQDSRGTELIFNKQNYILMLIGAVLIFGGMLLMVGGSQPDPNTWDPDIIYSKRITLLGPVVIITGLIVEIVAIFKRT